MEKKRKKKKKKKKEEKVLNTTPHDSWAHTHRHTYIHPSIHTSIHPVQGRQILVFVVYQIRRIRVRICTATFVSDCLWRTFAHFRDFLSSSNSRSSSLPPSFLCFIAAAAAAASIPLRSFFFNPSSPPLARSISWWTLHARRGGRGGGLGGGGGRKGGVCFLRDQLSVTVVRVSSAIGVSSSMERNGFSSERLFLFLCKKVMT